METWKKLEGIFLLLTNNLKRIQINEYEFHLINSEEQIIFKQSNKPDDWKPEAERNPNGFLNFNGNIFWDEFKLNSDDTRIFLKCMMEKHFKFNMDGIGITSFGEIVFEKPIAIDLKNVPQEGLSINLGDYIKKDESNSPLF